MKDTHPSNGLGFCGMLTLLFIALKLLRIIDWSWKWVLAPLWMPILIAIILICVMTILASKG
jgi:hypothetical protein